jgi:ABC-2 type transport system ATP-binding protein
VGLLLAIAHRPQLLILDEPSSGLDPVVRRDILGAIIRAVADEGRTVLFSSHLLEEVQRVSDRVGMLHEGQMILCEDVDTLIGQHCRVVIRLPQPVTEVPEIPGALSCSGMNREWTVVCNGRKDAMRSWVNETGGEIVEESLPTLEEIFVARSTGLIQQG